MRKITWTAPIRYAVAAATLAGLAAPMAYATPGSGTASVDATAEIVAAISLSKSTDLTFGHVAKGPAPGTVAMSTNGSRTATGGVTLATLTGVTPTAATFTVTGDPNASYAITLPDQVILTRAGGTETMTLDSLVSNPNGASTIAEEGASPLAVGGTLHVDANQVSGSYSGNFPVTVAYN